MKITDLLLLGAVAFGAWYFLRGSSTLQSNPVTTLGTQIYNDPTSVFTRMKAAYGYQQLNDGQWRQLLAQYSTDMTAGPVSSSDRMTLFQWWPLAFPNSGVQLSGLGRWAA